MCIAATTTTIATTKHKINISQIYFAYDDIRFKLIYKNE